MLAGLGVGGLRTVGVRIGEGNEDINSDISPKLCTVNKNQRIRKRAVFELGVEERTI
jgi:hypothetical protein